MASPIPPGQNEDIELIALADDSRDSTSISIERSLDENNHPDSSKASQDDDNRKNISSFSQSTAILGLKLPQSPQFPTIKSVLQHRFLAFFSLLLASFPLLFFVVIPSSNLVLKFQERSLFEIKKNTPDLSSKKYIFGPPAPTTEPIQFSYTLISAACIMIPPTAAFVISFNFTLREAKKIIQLVLLHMTIEIIAYPVLEFYVKDQNAFIRTIGVYVAAYITPIFISYMVGRAIATAAKKKYPKIKHTNKFGPKIALLSVFTGVSLLVYQAILVNIFFDPSTSLTVQLLLRLILHPVLVEFVLLPWRLVSFYMQNLMENCEGVFYFDILPYSVAPIFSLIGRVLIASYSDILTSILVSLAIALEDLMYRSTLAFRDSFFSKILKFPVNSAHHCSWILFDELFESVSVIYASIIIALFRIVTGEYGQPVDIWDLVLLTFVGLLSEMGSDLLRSSFYLYIWHSNPESFSISPNKDDQAVKPSFFTSLRTRSTLFYNSIEYWIIETQDSQHPFLFKAFFPVAYFCLGSYYIALLVNLHMCGRLTLSNNEIFEYYCINPPDT